MSWRRWLIYFALLFAVQITGTIGGWWLLGHFFHTGPFA